MSCGFNGSKVAYFQLSSQYYWMVFPQIPFQPSKGIRHGEPLSQCQFIIMAIGLARIIKAFKDQETYESRQS